MVLAQGSKPSRFSTHAPPAMEIISKKPSDLDDDDMVDAD